MALESLIVGASLAGVQEHGYADVTVLLWASFDFVIPI